MNSYSKSEIIALEMDVATDDWKPRSPFVSKYRLDNAKYFQNDRVKNSDSFTDKQHLLNNFGEYYRLISREWWLGMMHTRTTTRHAVFLSGVIGYTMLALPTLDIAQAVVRDLLDISWYQ